MKELKKWNNNPIKITYLIPSGNKYAYIKLGDTVDLTNGTYKITALDNEKTFSKRLIWRIKMIVL